MSTESTRYQIIPAAEHTPLVGAVVAMLENARASVIASVHGLSPDDLSHQVDEKANPIGSLLAHIAAVEWTYVVMSLEGRQPRADEWATWGNYLRLSPDTWAATKGQSIEQHLERLHTVRAETLVRMSQTNDEWLLSPLTLVWTPEPSNHLWAWYHVIEDELNHRGQIRWLKQRL
jgi:uncharacterized damage-inducible protein DinB